MIYLDASAVISLFTPDVHTPVIRGHLQADRSVLGISDFTVAEFASAVARRVRMKELTTSQADRLLNVSDAWIAANAQRLDLHPVDIRVATTFVRRFALGLRAPDAVHLAVCQRMGLPLFTFDRRQAAAANELGIECVTPPAV